MNSKIILTIFIGFIFIFSNIYLVSAWDDCPFGYKNDTYPGKCGRYIDTNNNGICDHSEPKPIHQVINNFTTNNSTTFLTEKNQSKITTKTYLFTENINYNTPHKRYLNYTRYSISCKDLFLLLMLITIIVYIISRITIKKRNFIIYRKLWNNILLLSSLIVTLTGVCLLFNIGNLKLMYLLHVTVSGVVIISGILHILERYNALF